MGWELWHDEGDSYGRIGFFCNTADVSFGPVIYTDSGFDKKMFYELWDKSSLPDARSMTETELSTNSRHLVRLSGWEDLVIVTMSVYKSDGTNAPVKIFEKASKEAFQNAHQSPFHKELEALFDYETEEGESQFDFINWAIEDMNKEMDTLILSQSDKTKIEQHSDADGITVAYEWEVLDEY